MTAAVKRSDEYLRFIAGYIIGADGVVYRKNADGTRVALATRPNDNGYRSVDLWDRGERRHYPIYWLVARMFLDARPSTNHVVCHRNGHSQDDRACNLYWGTYADNAMDRSFHKTRRGHAREA